MPQFDFFSFFVQIFWFSVFVLVTYLIYLKLFVVKIAKVLKMRKKLKTFFSNVSQMSNSKILYNSIIKYTK